MSEQVDRDTQAVVDAVIGGNADRLGPALVRLADSAPADFLSLTTRLIDTAQHTHVPLVGVCLGVGPSDFYHAEGKVFGAVYTPDAWFSKKAGPCGVGLPYEQVFAISIKARAEHDETVLKKAVRLKESLDELDKLLTGHSFADSNLTSFARADLFKGHALLIAALNPIKHG